MTSRSLGFLHACTGLVLLGGCPGESASPSTGDSSDTGSSDATSSGSTTGDPDGSTTDDPSTTVTTVDPDSSGSESSEGSSSGGFVGCGDGDVDPAADEQCDGDNLDGRDCASEDFVDGVLACNADCTLDTSGCNYMCGDGNVQGDEQCEGNEFEGADCMSLGFDGGDLDCAADCTFITTGCENYVCGDGTVAGPEVCDGVDLGGEDCVSQGFDSGTLACGGDCTAFDVSGCFVCGDGVINGDEVCDGAALAGETCVSMGLEGGVLSCAADCTFDLAECVGCGNGDQDPGEDCDTNDFGGVSCSDLGFDGGQLTCTGQCEIVTDSCAGLHTFCTAPSAAIGPGAGTLTQSTIPVAGLAGTVVDVDVLVDGSHTALGDLEIGVRHVDTDQSVSLAADQCGTADDINATFDQDAGSAPTCAGTPAIAGNVLPVGNLDGYVGTVGPGNGTWELSVLDQTDGNGGTLDQWCVAITTARTVRPNLLQCGNSGRDISAFIPDGEEFQIVFSCTPDEDTQAILITRDGAFDGPTLQAYVADGGIVLTEVFISDAVFNAVFNEAVLENGFFGSCTDIAPTVEQFTPGDPFWAANDFVGITLGESGCGSNIVDYPGVVPLAGWAADQVSIGYRDDGPGRVWLTEFDWSDGEMAEYAYTEQLMGSMILTAD